MKYWTGGDIPEEGFSKNLPFNIELFCREMDAKAAWAEKARKFISEVDYDYWKNDDEAQKLLSEYPKDEK